MTDSLPELKFSYFDSADAPADIDLRPCGECYACCVWLGINELKKHAGTSCSKLDGSLGATCRCSIYDSRPQACKTYSCGWRSGLGEDFMRPDKSGILIGYYRAELPDTKFPVAATIAVIDPKKAGTLAVGHLRGVIDVLITHGFDDIRIVHHESRTVIHFLNGVVRQGRLMKNEPNNFEGLKFVTYDPPIGNYERKPIQ